MKKLIILSVFSAFVPCFLFAAVLTFERVSVTSGGVEGNSDSYSPDVSATDGRYIAFASDATNLVAGDTNGVTDIFVFDRVTDIVERVSVSSVGVEGDDGSSEPAISDDGRYVAFLSNATNLVAGDTNATQDVFVFDRDTDTIERVNVATGGAEADHFSSRVRMSGDGRYVAFTSFATTLVPADEGGLVHVFVRDRQLDTTELVSEDGSGTLGDGNSDVTGISADGNLVVFYSTATNFGDGGANFANDVFVYDRGADTIELISQDGLGTEGNSDSAGSDISADGRYVAFVSDATNLVAGDLNGVTDVFIYDRTLDTVEQVDIGDSERSYDLAMSTDGQYVLFVHEDNAGVDTGIYRYNNDTDTFLFVTDGATAGINGIISGAGSLSSDGAVLAFSSESLNLIAGDTNDVTDVFVYDETPAPTTADLTVTKVVINDDAGVSVVGDFTLTLDGLEITSGVATTTTAGTYTVAETGPAGYTSTFTGDCAADGEIIMTAGNSYACTLTNNDTAVVGGDDDDGGGGSSSRVRTVQISNPIIEILTKLIFTLRELIALLTSQQAGR